MKIGSGIPQPLSLSLDSTHVFSWKNVYKTCVPSRCKIVITSSVPVIKCRLCAIERRFSLCTDLQIVRRKFERLCNDLSYLLQFILIPHIILTFDSHFMFADLFQVYHSADKNFEKYFTHNVHSAFIIRCLQLFEW